ncbi:MAG: hypothetical protein V4710_05545, partial [Verrucomicrobiota bacterium]
MQIAVRNVVTNVNTQAFPASIYGRLDSVGFTQLMASADNLPEPLRDEIFRIAITWWGSRPDKAPYDIESLGHVPSRVDSSKVHVLCVRPFGSKQPIRAVVTVPLTAYRHFGCNPFTFAQAGFFGFLKAFLREPNSLGVCESAIGPASSLTRVPPGSAPLDDRVLAAAIDPLLGAKPRLIACSEASHELRDLIEAIVAAMPVELRSKTAIFSFAYASDATVQAATPVLAGIFDKSAPPLPSIETFGPPTSEALTAVLRARHDPTGETLRDSPQDDLGNSVRELRRRVEELEQQGLAAAVDSAPATPRPVTSPPEQHACPQEPEAGSSEKGKEKQPAIRPVVVSRPSIGLLLALAAASVLTAVALCAAFFFHYLGIEHPLQGATEAEQLVPRLRMLERRVGGPSSADDSLFRQIQQLENDLGRPEDPTTLFGRVSLLRNQLGDEGRSGLALAVGHLETAFKTLNSELLDLQSKLGTGDAPPSESLRARQTKMKTALGEMELGLNRLSTELMDFEQNKLGSGTVPAEGSLRAKQVQIGTTLGKLDSVLGGLGAELSNFEKNMIGIGDTPLRGSLRARQMQLNDTSMTVATLDRLEKTLGTLNHQLAEFDRNKIGNEEKPPAGSLRARQKQLNDTSMTMATLDRLEKTLGTLNQQLAEF